jgi:hypothetical protein
VIAGPALLAVALSLPVVAAPRAAFDLSAQTQTLVRKPGDQGVGVDKPATESYDWQLGAATALALDFRTLRLRFGYTPKLTFNDFTHQPIRNVYQTGSVGLLWTLPRLQLSLTETFSYGDRYYTALNSVAGTDPATGTPVVQTLPQATTVRDISSDTALQADLSITRRTLFHSYLGYQLGGGANEASRVIVPAFTSARGLFSIEHRLTPRDGLISLLQLIDTHTKFAGAPDVRVFVGGVGEQWRRQWAKNTSGLIGAGFVFVPPYEGHDAMARPTGIASLSQLFLTGPERGTLQLTASAAADVVIDRLTGQPDARGQLVGAAQWNVRQWIVTAQGQFVRSFDKTTLSAVSLRSGELRVAFLPVKQLTLEAGTRLLKQRSLNPDIPTPPLLNKLQWTAFVSATYRFDTVQF